MNREKLLAELKSIINNFQDENGWTDLALIGNYLSLKGINFKAYGFLKLKEFIQEFQPDLELRIDNSFDVPVAYCRICEGCENSVKQSNLYYRERVQNKILSWAWMGDYRQTIQDLKNLALRERWYYKTQNPRFPFPILTKYLTYTFYRLASENNKISMGDRYAAFNTGLVDKRYEPIFALFEKNKIPGKQEWYFHEFCIPGENKAGKILTSHFNPLPGRAHYFESLSDMVYDINAPEPQVDWKHIILGNVARLPFEFILDNCPRDFELRDPIKMDTIEQDSYFRELAEAIEYDPQTYRSIKNRFKDSVDLAIKKVQWNYKTAIPMYYPKTNKLSMLLPLALMDDEIIDLALVVEKTTSGNYLGHTVLPLAWAYSNARLITRPDSDWLIAEQIGQQTETEETEEDKDID